MKIAFPLMEDKGLDSIVHNHFGSARFFMLVEDSNRSVEIIVNEDADHLHGACNPLKALGGHRVEAVIVGGIGGNALKKLNDEGIVVYRGIEGTIAEHLDLLIKHKLPEFTMNQTCAGHTHPDGCVH